MSAGAGLHGLGTLTRWVIAQACALVYNWWRWYCRAANPGARMEAITSRPLLLAAVDKAESHARQTTLYLTPMHGKASILRSLIVNIRAALQHVRVAAEQFNKVDPCAVLMRSVSDKIASVEGHECRASVEGQVSHLPSDAAIGVANGRPDPRRTFKQLGGQFTCVAPDLPGHGDSPDPIAPGFESIVGVSFGALCAIGLAQRHPALVHALVLADATLGRAEHRHARHGVLVVAALPAP